MNTKESMESALKTIIEFDTCECDSRHGYECQLCQARQIARDALLPMSGYGKTKVYIIGMISKDPNWKAKFQKVKDKYIDMGYTVLSPLDHPDGLTYEQYMQRSMEYVFLCNAIVALPDWEDSPGSKPEFYLASCLCKPIIFE